MILQYIIKNFNLIVFCIICKIPVHSTKYKPPCMVIAKNKEVLFYSVVTAILITPSSLFSKISYAFSMSLRAKRWVISGVVSILPCSMSERISSQSQPSTPPVLKIRFLPYISGRGRLCGLS